MTGSVSLFSIFVNPFSVCIYVSVLILPIVDFVCVHMIYLQIFTIHQQLLASTRLHDKNTSRVFATYM